jgi:hypothetical protein
MFCDRIMERKPEKACKKGLAMYRKADRDQIDLGDFFLPFGGELSASNRWVKMARAMPWGLIEDLYEESFESERKDGRPPLPARIAFGAIYIKEQENLTDRKTLEFIAENPYAQYFLGLASFQREPLFDHTMMAYFRRRFTPGMIDTINEELYRRTNPPKPPDDGSNDGTLVLDATVAPADIRYPTDVSLLNECRENTEKMIDILYEEADLSGRRTTYNRKNARARYLKIAKQRKPGKKKVQKAIEEQLAYVKKNLDVIGELLVYALAYLMPDQWLRLETIEKVVEQQASMLANKSHSVEDRIVSLRQPHVRPMVRGKTRFPVEFGQKMTVSVVGGFTFIERQSWDNFSEGKTLIESVEKYKDRHGVYPKAILADKTYRNRENISFCKQHGIRLSGPRLGRPKRDEVEADREQAYQDGCDRNIVESRYGIAKRRYGLDLIMARYPETAETEAGLNILAMNMAHLLRVLLRFFSKLGDWTRFGISRLILSRLIIVW